MKMPDEMPTQGEIAQLITQLIAVGFKGQALAAIIVLGRTRRQIANGLIGLCKEAEKAK